MEYRYPNAAIVGDSLRAIVGLLICTVPLLVLTLPQAIFTIIAIVAAAFGLFGALTWWRHQTRFRFDEHALTVLVSVGTGDRQYAWHDLKFIRLSYFSVRRDGENGWMELKLKFAGRTVRVDSRLTGFAAMARAALNASAINGLDLDSATSSNFEALGVETGQNVTDGPLAQAALRRVGQPQAGGTSHG